MIAQSGYCEQCGRTVRLYQDPKTNHILHLLLSILTCGLWLVVWLYKGTRAKGYYCTACGTEVVYY
jgi:hypothetical protein